MLKTTKASKSRAVAVRWRPDRAFSHNHDPLRNLGLKRVARSAYRRDELRQTRSTNYWSGVIPASWSNFRSLPISASWRTLWAAGVRWSAANSAQPISL